MNKFSKTNKYKIDPNKAKTVDDCLLLMQILFRYLTQTPIRNKTLGFSVFIEDEESYERIKHLIMEEN